ncbi:MAG: DUF2852 domain-containing protein [Paracoccus sp. (in: a-proteobacteria)]|uniref:DUF2852 domain-containing protein n=1 Tax=Paracoccus sp. TaxID=267 RepID=UPI0026DF482B|nr:DUF2852 domain-containing protein [Paracoccus sp. (in: a-proteobacteria)]MDO5620677.1 DUF2852 domain-containing protein [Paracoccus sp. (in: a-proteobacteria)]
MTAYTISQPVPRGLLSRIGDALAGIRDWLDTQGRPAWFIATIAGFFIAPPLGLAILVYAIWSKRMFTCAHRRETRMIPTGNSAFDAYRAETLKRLEQEQQDFMAFLDKLREAKDRAEFEQFVADRDTRN